MATIRYQLDGQEHWVNLKDATTIGRADINDVCVPSNPVILRFWRVLGHPSKFMGKP